MEAREAAEILALMRGSWPNLAQDEVADRLWLEDLMGCDVEPALKTFRWLRDHVEFAPTWAVFRERYFVAARPSIKEQIALEPPKPPTSSMTWTKVRASRDAIRERQREERVMERIKNRPPFPAATKHSGLDPLTPMLTYEEVYESEPLPQPSVSDPEGTR